MAGARPRTALIGWSGARAGRLGPGGACAVRSGESGGGVAVGGVAGAPRGPGGSSASGTRDPGQSPGPGPGYRPLPSLLCPRASGGGGEASPRWGLPAGPVPLRAALAGPLGTVRVRPRGPGRPGRTGSLRGWSVAAGTPSAGPVRDT